MRGPRAPAKAKRTSLQATYHRFVYRLSEHHAVSGLPVRILWPSEEERSIALAKVAEALDLVVRYDPRRFARILDDVAGILLFGEVGALGTWHYELGLIQLQLAYVVDPSTTAAEVAVTVVHEAMHARLSRRGFAYSPECRQRIEAVCCRAEIAFASRLPDATELVQDAERNLAREAEFWSDEAMRGRTISNLRSFGVPSWLVWLLGRLWNRRAA
jgi:hypothetical protein